jgi:hypothetical protein
MDSVLNIHDVAKRAKFYLGELRFNVTFIGNAGVSNRAVQCIINVTVWRVLRKRLNLEAYKLSIVQHLERRIDCTALNINFFVTLAKQ